ncbi:MAG TPA: hypothetical protein VKT78_13795, partial [Fimbriimonadaceae bacterium]|nr:hypothetical protein [Fimbriimonadaceae bacterium]
MLVRPLLLLCTLLGGSHQQPTRFAATFPQHVETEVCGQPALPETVASAVDAAIRCHTIGASDLDLSFEAPATQPLFGGQKATFHVNVLATAPDRIQRQGDVTVTVRNTGSSIGHEPVLWFCNKPENLRTSGPLFDG